MSNQDTMRAATGTSATLQHQVSTDQGKREQYLI